MTQQSVSPQVTVPTDIDELRGQVCLMIAAVMTGSGLLATLAHLPVDDFYLEGFLLSGLITAQGMLALALARTRLLPARGLILTAPLLNLYLGAIVFDHPYVPAFAAAAALANAAISPKQGLLAAGAYTVPVWLLYPTSISLPAIGLLWLTLTTAFIASRALYQALDWARNSESLASRLVQTIQRRQGELNRSLDAYKEATRRLERTRNELAVARVRADDARMLKDRFAANISHELRTPLNLILGFSEVMYLTPDTYGEFPWPMPLRQDVRQIYQSARHLLDLINDVLDLSRMDASEMPILRERCDPSSVVYEAVATIADLVERKGLVLDVSMPDRLPQLMIDRTRIRQVMLNLINNAIRFTETGSIIVSASTHDDEVIISVADTGIGIPAKELGNVFKEFRQVDMSLHRPQSGAGLGLAICKRLIELHGGRIWAESRVGEGSVFSIALPTANETGTSSLAYVAARQPDLSIAKREMIVCAKDPFIGSALGRHIESVRFIQSEDPHEARELVSQRCADGLIVNVAPDEDVWAQFPKYLDLVPSDKPVFVCSMPSSEWARKELGVVGYLVKPVERETLLSHIQDAMAESVLVVDDDRGFVQLVSRYLQLLPQPIAMSWAYDADEALQKMDEELPDLVLLDLALPGMSGRALLDAMRVRDYLRSTKVLVVTATDRVRQHDTRDGGHIFVGKPNGFTLQETVRFIQYFAEPLTANSDQQHLLSTDRS